MHRIGVLAVMVLASTGVPATARTTECAQATELAAARGRWNVRPRLPNDATDRSEACRVYSYYFYEAVTTRQAIAVCGSGISRKHDPDVVDSEIETFDNLIATYCNGARRDWTRHSPVKATGSVDVNGCEQSLRKLRKASDGELSGIVAIHFTS